MKREVIIVDNFYQNPEAVAEYARTLPYYNPYANRDLGSSAPEHTRKAVWLSSFFRKAEACPFKSSETLLQTLENITGEEVDREHWNRDFPEDPMTGALLNPRPDVIDPAQPPRFENLKPDMTSCRWNCGFHVKLPTRSGKLTIHNHVYAAWNCVGMDGWAGLIYLNKDAPRDSGLKTFRNKRGSDWEWMTAEERWQVLDDYANVYNRLILIRGSMPHSGGPGFGDNFNNGRLFQTLFFRSKKIKTFESVPVKLEKAEKALQ